VTWQPGRDRIKQLIDDEELDEVTPDVDVARRLLADAGRHLATTSAAASTGDLSGAYQLAYDAFRKSAASLLAAQGLRATSRGGHLAVQEAVIDQVEGPRLLLLGGRSWRVTWTDWKRRRCFVEPAESGGRARWLTSAVGGISYEVARSMRDVLLGAEVTVTLTRRGAAALAGLRSDAIGRVWPGGTVISRSDTDLRWWTWAGYRVNATLKATLGGLADENQRVDDLSIRLRSDLRPQTWHKAVEELKDHLCLPEVDEKAVAGLKFSEALPRHLAVSTLATRLADMDRAASTLMEPCRFAQ
jgi:hypothetical protein